MKKWINKLLTFIVTLLQTSPRDISIIWQTKADIFTFYIIVILSEPQFIFDIFSFFRIDNVTVAC